MNYSVVITDQANADLRGIFEYIAFELQSAQNAASQLSRIETAIISLEHMPERFNRYRSEPWRDRGMRLMPVDRYCVLYIPDQDNSTVNIIRVVYGGRDIDAELVKRTAE